MKGLETTALYDACMRHLAAWMQGEDVDPESGLTHLGHAAANLNMLMWTLGNKPEMDDRPHLLPELKRFDPMDEIPF